MDQLTFLRQYEQFKTDSERAGAALEALRQDVLPCLDEDTAETAFDRHYVYHPAWAARVLAADPPARHVDISSTLHFCGVVSAFIPVDFYDYRPADLRLDGLTSARADLLALPFDDRSVPSISCMHTVEHIGLGRYGDPIDPLGDVKAMRELERVIAIGGSLLFVVPVGRPRVSFNAHRVYAASSIPALFPELRLAEFALITEDGRPEGLTRNAALTDADGQEYGCGCFHFVRD